MARVGILAVQGAVAPHAAVLRRLGHAPVLLRGVADFAAPLEGLVLPGGESSVQLELLARLGIEAALCALVRRGVPVLATCAGLILLAREVQKPAQRSLGFLDVTVVRNGWGRQVDSFEGVSEEGRPLVFIRAPRITAVGAAVTVLDRFQGEPILVRSGRITGATFHPELTPADGLHREVFGVGDRGAARAVARGGGAIG